MKSINIKELFDGYDGISIPDGISLSTLFSPTASSESINDSSILFVTERVGRKNTDVDMSTMDSIPAALVVSDTCIVKSVRCPIIRAKNVRTALSFAFSNAYRIDYNKLKFIGITGTNGKTTTATLIYEMLIRCGYRVGFIGTGKIISNGVILTSDTYSMTTPDPSELYPAISKMQDDGCEYVVMEVSSHSLALGKVAPIKFEYAIFTNLDEDHLDFHLNKAEYFKVKLSLFKQTKRGLFNLDDEYSRYAYELSECEKISIGIINPGDSYATEIKLRALRGSSFFYRSNGLIFKVNCALPGAFNVYNSLCAIRCIIDLGIKPCIAKRAFEDIHGIDGRMEIFSGFVTAVIDYAHTPCAFYNCLKTLKSNIINEQSLIIVFGCGGERDKHKRHIFGKHADDLADKIILTEDNSRDEPLENIIHDIASGISKRTYKIIPDRECAIRYAFEIANEGDIVAVIGKGHERYKITAGEYVAFDERKIISDAMKKASDRYASRA